MKPWETLAMAVAPDGSPLTLARRDAEYVLRVRGHVLMSSRQHASEDALAREACARIPNASNAKVLIGGLGFGFTLRAALDCLGAEAEVTVAEILPALIEWNRGPLAALAGGPLEDPRSRTVEGDVARVIAKHPKTFDAILLDVDNGPFGLAQAKNQHLYALTGLRGAVSALASGGVLAVWSAGDDPAFGRRMEEAGLRVEALQARAHPAGGSRHTLFFGETRRARGVSGSGRSRRG